LDISCPATHGYPSDRHFGKFAVEDENRNNDIEFSLTNISNNECNVVHMINKQILLK
jgi:hypothetical protein